MWMDGDDGQRRKDGKDDAVFAVRSSSFAILNGRNVHVVKRANFDRNILWAKRLDTVFTRENRMLRASLPSSGRLSVCPSVCPSVTLVSCIKTLHARITKSSLWAAPGL